MRWQLLIPKMAILNSKTRAQPKAGCRRDFLSAPLGLFSPMNPATRFRGAAAGRNSIGASAISIEHQRASRRVAIARAVMISADFATNNTERAALAEQGIAACRQLLAREPKSAPGHYYLGMNFGQTCRCRGSVHGRLQARPRSRTRVQVGGGTRRTFRLRRPARDLVRTLFQAPGCH